MQDEFDAEAGRVEIRGFGAAAASFGAGADDGEAEAGAAVVTGTGGVGAVERFKKSFGIGVTDTGAVVVEAQGEATVGARFGGGAELGGGACVTA